MAESRTVCILSPPRSGSSLTARIMNILGVHLGGSEDFISPSVHNPKGYWEHETIQRINDEILARLGYDYSRAGADWAEPPTFADGWATDPKLSDLRERARGLIVQSFSAYDIWGWKDPRTCFTLPFWQSILPEMQYVILIRKPMDVARSIERFLDCSFERGLYMWFLFLNFAFRHTVNQHRLIVNTDAWSDDRQGELNRLAQFLGKPELAVDKDVQAEIDKLFDKSLWHHRTSSGAFLTVHRLYEQLATNDGSLRQDPGTDSDETLHFLAAEALRSDADKEESDRLQWRKQMALASAELSDIVPRGKSLIFVDDDQIGLDIVEGRNVIPFIERNGQYWGRPADGVDAVREFERLRANGADYMAFIWPARWWLDYFPELNDHLRSGFHCILQNERLTVFRLQS